jgi:hypothetical protein
MRKVLMLLVLLLLAMPVTAVQPVERTVTLSFARIGRTAEQIDMLFVVEMPPTGPGEGCFYRSADMGSSVEVEPIQCFTVLAMDRSLTSEPYRPDMTVTFTTSLQIRVFLIKKALTHSG